MKRHQDKVIVVTGAGRGLGRAYAQRLASEGARIAICEIDARAGAAVAEDLRNNSANAIFIETDVASKEGTEFMAARVLEKWGQIDGLVTNAGLANSVGGQTYDEITVPQWDRIMEVNVRAAGSVVITRWKAIHLRPVPHSWIVDCPSSGNNSATGMEALGAARGTATSDCPRVVTWE